MGSLGFCLKVTKVSGSVVAQVVRGFFFKKMHFIFANLFFGVPKNPPPARGFWWKRVV